MQAQNWIAEPEKIQNGIPVGLGLQQRRCTAGRPGLAARKSRTTQRESTRRVLTPIPARDKTPRAWVLLSHSHEYHQHTASVPRQQLARLSVYQQPRPGLADKPSQSLPRAVPRRHPRASLESSAAAALCARAAMGFKGQLGKLIAGKNAPPPAQPAAPVAPPMAAPPPWDAQRFRVMLNLAKNRIDIQAGKKENEINATRREIAQHLSASKETLARIHCERVLRDRAQRQAFDILQTFIDILKNSHTVFTSQRDFDSASPDLKESVASVVFATTRVNVQELHNVTDMLRAHFGANIIDPIQRVDGPHVICINNLLANSLDGGQPDGYLVLQELTKISAEYNVSWMAPPEYTDLDKGGPGNQGGPGGDHGYYRPVPMNMAPHNVPGMDPSAPMAPPAPAPGVDMYAPAAHTPTNIPGGYGAPPPYGAHAPPSAPPPYDPSGSAPGTLYPPGPPSAPPPPGDDGFPHTPGSLPPPPPGPSFLSDDALAAKFRNVKDNYPGSK